MKPIEVLAILALAAVGILALAGFALTVHSRCREFFRELRYIESEIERTEGQEQAYWQRRKRRHWRSLLPFSSGKRG